MILAGPEDEARLPHLARFFSPLFEQSEGTTTGRQVTGFQVNEEVSDWAKSLPWDKDFAAIEEFAQHHQVTLTAQLRWQGDGEPANPADDRGHVVFDIHGNHHQVADSDQTAQGHRQRSCTCYRNPAPHPTPEPSLVPVGAHHPTVGLIDRIHSGQLTDYVAHCTEHGQIVFTSDENLASAQRSEHIARHHS
ncbi:hypothetical protein ACH4UR_25495 [Streptomyces lydicus]|uniref:hypothetical protein n=1 Tax=Streptomyces lydicus TaxID=47763 RepID=UPI0033DC6EC9